MFMLVNEHLETFQAVTRLKWAGCLVNTVGLLKCIHWMEMGDKDRYNELKNQDDKSVDSETKETEVATNEALTEAFIES